MYTQEGNWPEMVRPICWSNPRYAPGGHNLSMIQISCVWKIFITGRRGEKTQFTTVCDTSLWSFHIYFILDVSELSCSPQVGPWHFLSPNLRLLSCPAICSEPSTVSRPPSELFASTVCERHPRISTDETERVLGREEDMLTVWSDAAQVSLLSVSTFSFFFRLLCLWFLGQLMDSTFCPAAATNLWSCGVGAKESCWRPTADTATRFWMLMGEQVDTHPDVWLAMLAVWMLSKVSSTAPRNNTHSDRLSCRCLESVFDCCDCFSSAASSVPTTTARSAPAAPTRLWSCGMWPQARLRASSEVTLGSVQLLSAVLSSPHVFPSCFHWSHWNVSSTESQLCPVQWGGVRHLIRFETKPSEYIISAKHVNVHGWCEWRLFFPILKVPLTGLCGAGTLGPASLSPSRFSTRLETASAAWRWHNTSCSQGQGGFLCWSLSIRRCFLCLSVFVTLCAELLLSVKAQFLFLR